ncbi:MAG: hypothetical protein RMJ17_01090 [Candidatus Aenigmarchaeota archaeon]|nr:hypothetical protein [Candidatus Aenigmarchaeota archaeon]MDW8149181.1 hypothetical protein [Candidatus Aenigmarchaeota archaeon]
MKEIIGFLVFVFFIILLVLFLTSLLFKVDIGKVFYLENFENFTRDFFERKNENNLTSTTIENISVNGKIEEKIKKEKAIYTKIVDICSPLGEERGVIEGAGLNCLNKEEPYRMEISTVNESHSLIKFLDYNETFVSTNQNLFIIVIKGINLVANETKNIYFEPIVNFYLNNYTIYTVWISDEIYEISASLPISIKNESINKKFEEELKFYVETFEKTFYAGSLFVKKI